MRNCCFVGMPFSLLFLFTVSVTAQEPVSATPLPAPAPAAKQIDERLQLENAEKDRPVTEGLKIEKKITGRLPNGYRNVVTNVQRDDIYKIQKEYMELIEFLKLRIDLLEQERDKQVDTLLTPAQIEKIKSSQGALASEKNKQKKEAVPKRTAKSNESE